MNRQNDDQEGNALSDERLRKSEERSRLRRAFGRRIAEARRRAGLTQTELAEALDVRSWMINRYERGRSAPRFDVIVRLRGALGVSLDYLLAGITNPPAPPSEAEGPPRETSSRRPRG
jgi:ribosome-binding protein aMBF1 (putative translation factor)